MSELLRQTIKDAPPNEPALRGFAVETATYATDRGGRYTERKLLLNGDLLAYVLYVPGLGYWNSWDREIRKSRDETVQIVISGFRESGMKRVHACSECGIGDVRNGYCMTAMRRCLPESPACREFQNG